MWHAASLVLICEKGFSCDKLGFAFKRRKEGGLLEYGKPSAT